MHENSLPSGGAEARIAVRTNLFLAATLHADAGAHPVKIRDLSASGAQIESALIPLVGTAISLTRGSLSVRGHVAWTSERRCGVTFSSNVSVQDWMANPLNAEQQRVDRIITAVKAGAVPLVAPAHSEAKASIGTAVDLANVSRLLEILGDALAGDPEVVARHGAALQNIDIAVQTLTTLTATLEPGGDKALMARLDELRSSCAQALRAKP